VVEWEVFFCHLHAVSGVTERTEHSGYLACELRFDPGPTQISAGSPTDWTKRAINTLHLDFESQSLLNGEIIASCNDIGAEHVNTL